MPLIRPERWLTPDGSTIDENKRSELISFGFGPRQCPGRHLAMRELLCFAVELLHTFEGFRLLEDRVVTPKFSNLLTSSGNLVVAMQCRRT